MRSAGLVVVWPAKGLFPTHDSRMISTYASRGVVPSVALGAQSLRPGPAKWWPRTRNSSEHHLHRLGIIMESLAGLGDVAIARPGEVIGHDRRLVGRQHVQHF